MNDYFPKEQGISYRMGTSAKEVVRTIANRFISDNPPALAVYYLRSRKNFSLSEDYMDEIWLHNKISPLENEDYCYAWATLTTALPGTFHFRFSAFGPVSIYVNSELQFRTNHTQERFSDEVSDIALTLEAGKNSLFFQCIATPLGCGFSIGSSSYKGRRIQFFSPLKERKGMSGFIWSGPFKKPVLEQIGRIPLPEEREEDTQLLWFPQMKWTDKERESTISERLFHVSGKEMVSAARFHFPVTGNYSLSANGGHIREIYIDGQQQEKKEIIQVQAGYHIIAVRGENVRPEIEGENKKLLEPLCPVPVADEKTDWIYAGPFDFNEELNIEELLTFKKPFQTGKVKSFWQTDIPQMYLRPFNEGALYGEWTYPLGVTLYGMIQAARILKDEAMEKYVEGHMRKCTEFYDYCMWDKSVYGAAPFHNQLTTMESLDDCGSFASALLETIKFCTIPEGRKIADLVASYIEKDQQRLEDGTFYRNHSYLPIMNETMWADDMYMSIPFLCRYYQLAGDETYLLDAICQVKRFYHYLFMPDLQIMSHIYDVHYQVQTKVPWGRGNGWVLFSITELLAVMPETHKDRYEILSIYRTLCEGYLKLQGEEGMWHQVLTFPHSYQETSCTAMFIYGFARGVRYGWLEEPEEYRKSAVKGWEALCRLAVDWKGNIYGVCRGSGYSFSKEYYANDLGWNFNDVHGTGIVMLAGIEVEKMKEDDGK